MTPEERKQIAEAYDLATAWLEKQIENNGSWLVTDRPKFHLPLATETGTFLAADAIPRRLTELTIERGNVALLMGWEHDAGGIHTCKTDSEFSRWMDMRARYVQVTRKQHEAIQFLADQLKWLKQLQQRDEFPASGKIELAHGQIFGIGTLKQDAFEAAKYLQSASDSWNEHRAESETVSLLLKAAHRTAETKQALSTLAGHWRDDRLQELLDEVQAEGRAALAVCSESASLREMPDAQTASTEPAEEWIEFRLKKDILTRLDITRGTLRNWERDGRIILEPQKPEGYRVRVDNLSQEYAEKLRGS